MDNKLLTSLSSCLLSEWIFFVKLQPKWRNWGHLLTGAFTRMNQRPKEFPLLIVWPLWDKNFTFWTAQDCKTEQVIYRKDLKDFSPRMHCPMRKKRPTRDSDFSAIAVPSMHGSGYLDYTVETHASRCLKVMEEFRRQEMLCDLVLHVANKDRTVDFKVRRPPNSTIWTQLVPCCGMFERIQLYKVLVAEYGSLKLTKCSERLSNRSKIQHQ